MLSLTLPLTLGVGIPLLTEGNILLLEFLFSRSKASDANIGIIANFV